jgi:predicted O-linked N-acetylglucosamine transferase (SPINDLY family)
MESAYRQMLQQSPNSSAKKTRQYQGNEPKKKQKFSLPIDRLKPAAVKSEKQNSENQKLSKRTPSKHQINTLLKYYESNKYNEAEIEAVLLTEEFPEHAFGWKVLGVLFKQRGRATDALDCMRKAAALSPDDAEIHNNLGVTLQALNRLDEAEASQRQAISLRPNYIEAHYNLGLTLQKLIRLSEAESSYKHAIKLQPSHAEAHNNVGVILQSQGVFDEAEASYRRAVILKPDYTEARDNLLYMQNYDPRLSAAELYREYAAYGAHVSSVTTRHFGHSGGLSVSGRRIRIGYSSPDFRGHACRFFMEPMFRAHDRDEFELFAYSNTAKPDGHTDRLKGYFDQWVDVTQLSDEAMAERIYADGIDILVDMAGHTKGNRLPVFAMRPAPIQVGSAIGYGYTTGLKEVDYFIGDENLTPEGSEPYFSETLWRVPAPAFVYVPPRDVTPEVSELPALRNGYVTFGSLTRTVRLNDPLLGVWKVILDRVPGSRLRLDQKPFAVEGTRELFWARLEGLGIARERVELTCSQLHWDAYEGIDITLDCWPHNAGTTTVESLWMGVPVLTKVDRPSVGCVGASYLRPLDLGAWVAEDEEAYIEKAVAYASDLTTLAQLRDCLRHRLEGSSLLDAVGGTQKMESAYRQMVAKIGECKQ